MSQSNLLKQMLCKKNLKSELIECNDVFLDYIGYKSEDLVLGRTDYEFAWSNYADLYRTHELDAMNGNGYSVIHPTIDANGRYFLAFNTKVPVFNKDKKIIGVSCHTIEVINPDFLHLTQWLKTTDIDNPLQNYAIGKKISGTELTTRELECLFYLLRGKTSKEIGKILNLSFRTVEGYIDNIKHKFNCRTKAELITAAIQAGYLNNIPKTLFTKKLYKTLKN